MISEKGLVKISFWMWMRRSLAKTLMKSLSMNFGAEAWGSLHSSVEKDKLSEHKFDTEVRTELGC